eukprot:TRINITY_DN36176_c0_g1_i1.p1 TRINITY_DN36176_c0_g1~~TRINITY_DN36176_c0_g1_i1.p1  ORF type:complete len:247 (+),score=57.07 TRINITY_DN36176_c0_g1_i1:59-742(+)
MAAAPTEDVSWQASASRSCRTKESSVVTRWKTLLDPAAPPCTAEKIDGFDAFLIRGFFSPEEAQRLVEASEKHGYGTTDYAPRYRGNLRLITEDLSLTECIARRVGKLFPQRVRAEQADWKFVGLNECWRLAKYHPGDQFGKHCDACYERSREERSMYTVNVYMSGDHRGGATRFFRGKEMVFKVDPEPGLALVFRQPPDEQYLHDGEQLQSGTKYLFRTDAMYRLS